MIQQLTEEKNKLLSQMQNCLNKCENDGYYNRNKSLISKTLKNNVDIDLSINVKDKKLCASIENLGMDIGDGMENWYIPTKKINYCPMCGRRLRNG